MSGSIHEREMNDWAEAYKQATDSYAGGPHMVLADMRGLLPCAPSVAEIMGATIVYARKKGVVCCVHLSDSATQRLQAARIARGPLQEDGVTIDVVSMEEAKHVLEERLRGLQTTLKSYRP